MKIRFTRLDFRKDKNYDPNHIIDDYYAKPYIVEYKKHWWQKYQFLMDGTICMPLLLYGEYDKNKVIKIIQEQTKRGYLNRTN